MVRGWAVTVVVLGALGTAPVRAQQVEVDTSGEQEMLARINAMRNAAGLGTLEREPHLDAAARTHSADMAWHDMLDHVSPRTGDPGARVRAAGITPAEIAENVALHVSTIEAYQSLLASEAHRANLMNPAYTHIGISSVHGARGYYVTQVLARIPAQPATPPPAPGPAPEAPAAPPLPPPVTLDPSQSPAAPPSTAPAAPPAAAPAPAPAPGAAAPPPAPGSAPGSGQVQLAQRTGSGQTIGYWVWAQGRWWYYPIPPGARPGQVLQPDLRVSGPPAGYGWNGARIAPPPPPDRRAPPAFGWSPRRSYRRWYWSN